MLNVVNSSPVLKWLTLQFRHDLRTVLDILEGLSENVDWASQNGTKRQFLTFR